MSGWEGLDVYEEDVGHEPLKYGDYIYLTALKQDSPNRDGFLWAEGQVFKRVGLQMLSGGLLQTQLSPPNFGQCVFRVCPQLQYENRAAMTGLKRQSSVTETEMKNVMQRLETESAKNQRTMTRLDEEAQPFVEYGDKVQLLHVKSNAVLSGQRAMADMNRQDLLLTLEDEGSNFALQGARERSRPRARARARADPPPLAGGGGREGVGGRTGRGSSPFSVARRSRRGTSSAPMATRSCTRTRSCWSTEIQGHTIGASVYRDNPYARTTPRCRARARARAALALRTRAHAKSYVLALSSRRTIRTSSGVALRGGDGWTVKRYCRINDEHDGPSQVPLFGQPNMTFRLWHPRPSRSSRRRRSARPQGAGDHHHKPPRTCGPAGGRRRHRRVDRQGYLVL